MSNQQKSQDLQEIRIDPARNVVMLGESEFSLEPKAMDVLNCLARAQGSVVSVDDLVSEAWPGRIVEDSSVHRRISQIRSALGAASYVETIPKRGYRLTVPARTSTTRANGNGALKPTNVCRLALFPLQDLSRDGSLHWLAEGLSVHLRSQLSYARSIKVVPGALVAHRQVERLPPETDLLIDGHVQVQGNLVYLGLEVIDLTSQTTLWQETFTSAQSDPYKLQTYISAGIARLLSESLKDKSAPAEPAAFLPYLKYLYHRDYSGYDQTRHWLELTLRQDTSWAIGRVHLALLYLRSGTVTRDEALINLGRSTLQQVVSDSEHKVPKGLLTFAFSWLQTYWQPDIAQAEETTASLAKVATTTPYGNLMLISGLVPEAEVVFAANVEQQPHDPYGWEMLMESRLQLGEFDGAVAAGRRLVELFPEQSPNAQLLLSWPLAVAGVREEMELLHAALESQPVNNAAHVDRFMIERGIRRDRFALAMALGDANAAAENAQWFENSGDRVLAAIMALRLGDQDRADQLLAEPINPDFYRFWWWKAMILIGPELREHDLISRIESQLGFTHAWRAEMAHRAARLDAGAIACEPQRYALPD